MKKKQKKKTISRVTDVPAADNGPKIRQTKTETLKWWRQRNSVILFFVIMALTPIPYFPAIQGEFTNWDDQYYVTENPLIRDLSLSGVHKIFTSPVSANYNPLPIFTYALEYNIWGLNPKAYHITNIILHVGCTALVFWLTILLSGNLVIAAVTTILFAVHPMRVESVAWITERKDVLFGFFYLIALISYVYSITTKKKKLFYVGLCYCAFTLSLLAKIQAVALPLSLLAIDYLYKRKLGVKRLIEKIPFFVLSLVTGLVGIHFLSAGDAFDTNQTYAVFDRPFLATYSLCSYIFRLVFPVNLAVFHPYPVKSGNVLPSMYYISLIAVAISVVFIVRSRKQTRALVFGTSFFFLNIMFLLQVVGAGSAFMADRFTYIPYIGLFYILGVYTDRLYQRSRIAALAIISSSAIVLTGLSWNKSHSWVNSGALWKDVINKYPDSHVGYNYRGVYYRQNGLLDEALADFDKAISLQSKYYDGYNNRGNVYFSRGEFEKALSDYTVAAKIKPGKDATVNNIGAIYEIKGKHNLALEQFSRAIQLNPAKGRYYFNRSQSLRSLGRTVDARADAERAANLGYPVEMSYLNSLK